MKRAVVLAALGTFATGCVLASQAPASTPVVVERPPAPPPDTPLTYGEWRSTSWGFYLAPEDRDESTFDVVMHYHLGKAADDEYRSSGLRAVFATATHGLFAPAYGEAYEDPERFGRTLDELSKLLDARTGAKGHKPGRIALFAWSAGYGSIRKILANPADYARVDAVVLLDGIHASYKVDKAGNRFPDPKDIERFVQFARDAAAGKKLMVVTHTQVVPSNYASTTECSAALLQANGVDHEEPIANPEEKGVGRTLVSRADTGDFHVLGYTGDGGDAHIGHIHIVDTIISEFLYPRWKSAVSRQPSAVSSERSADR